jgi:hypothetical protein
MCARSCQQNMAYNNPSEKSIIWQPGRSEGNDHLSIGLARFPTNPNNLRTRVVQVLNCELPKVFSDPTIGNRDSMRQSTEECWSGAYSGL